MTWFSDPNAWAALVTLCAMEIVLGIDNIIFISILAGKLPSEQRARARTLGLAVAMVSRLLLLFSITWIMRFQDPLLRLASRDISGRDLILIGGGLFLIWKATKEIHAKLEGLPESSKARGAETFAGVIVQIMIVDIVFSVDSVITAVGMVDDLSIMVAAVVVSVGVMLFAAGPVSGFVDRHPTVKMLALAFLLMIGTVLVAEGWHVHVPKGYIYFAMAFSVLVETLTLRMKRNLKVSP